MEEIYAPLEINLGNAKAIWKRIVQMEGEVFTKIQNIDFTYQINWNGIQIIGNNPYNLTK